MKCIVQPIKNITLALDNIVILNSPYKYVEIGQHIFKVLNDSTCCAINTILLNKNHCKMLNAQSYSSIQIFNFDDEKMNTVQLADLHIEFMDIHSRDKDIPDKLKYNEDDLIDFLKDHLKNHILTNGQLFFVELKGGIITTYKINILNNVQYGRIGRIVSIVSKIEKLLIKSSHLLNDFDLKKLDIGGLDGELETIFRRAFASRLYKPDVIKELGIKHVKGIILYGPPGTGKTLISRKLSQILNCEEPKIVSGPEILNKYIGESEGNIRMLFEDAEKDYTENGDKSSLHVIIFDEIDSICKKRGQRLDSAGVHDNIVNQLLSKMDGVNELNNILIIGMTNRLDLIDDALLRPGRFEIKLEIKLPDENGRREILDIHLKSMRQSRRLCNDINVDEIIRRTENYTGAEISGLVRSAVSFALNKHVDLNNLKKVDPNGEGIIISQHDFNLALEEMTPMFHKKIVYIPKDYMPSPEQLVECHEILTKLKNNTNNRIKLNDDMLGRYIANVIDIKFARVIESYDFIGMSDHGRSLEIKKIIDEALTCRDILIIFNNVEDIIDYTETTGYFSIPVLQTLKTILKLIVKSNLNIIIVSKKNAIFKLLEL